MPKPLPTMFIGSSSEKLDVVDLFVEVFSPYVECTKWTLADEFGNRGSQTTFSALCDAARAYDFAIFVITPDDILVHRDKDYLTPRDNVIFELGLFVAMMGPERVQAYVQQLDEHIVRHDNTSLKLPSDTLGINMPRFATSEDRKRLKSSIDAVTKDFANATRILSFRDISPNLAVGWGFEISERHFEVKLGAGPIEKARVIINNRQIVLAARLGNKFKNFEDDETVVFSEPNDLPAEPLDVYFRIPEDSFASLIREDTKIEGRILLLDPDCDLSRCITLKDAQEHGCRIVESISTTTCKCVNP
ncbi:MAG: nucleotide-binding protein [Pirellulaceae bacterium]